MELKPNRAERRKMKKSMQTTWPQPHQNPATPKNAKKFAEAFSHKTRSGGRKP